MIVDTATLAMAVRLSPRHICRLAKSGLLEPIPLRTGRKGRPSLWFDLDASVALLDKRRGMSLTDH